MATKAPLVVCALIAIAGCSKDSGPMSATKAADPSGWTKVKNAESGIALRVPPGWEAIDLSSDQVNASLDAAASANPEFAAIAPQVKAMATSGVYKMFIFHTEAPTDGLQFTDNINIIGQPARGMDLDAIFKAQIADAKTALNAKGEVKEESANLGGKDCRILTFEIDMQLEGKNVPASFRAYTFVHKDQAFIITCTTSSSRLPTLLSEFQKIIETVEFS